METIWKERSFPVGCDREMVENLAQETGVSCHLMEGIVKRGYTTYEEVVAYLEPTWEALHDPMALPDMEKTVGRILEARENKETICIYGDYDADGTAAVGILLDYFQAIEISVFYEIPNRLLEGYGMNLDGVRRVKDKGAKLIITVDTGISAHEQVVYANGLGMEVIVTDHHECHGELPPAFAVVDAKREDSTYPFSELCGAGIAFKLVQALEGQLKLGTDLTKYLEMAALATVADLVPLRGENRIIASLGIDVMNQGSKSLGIQALIEVSELQEVNASRIGYVMGPKINAAGRLGDAGKVIDLYQSKSLEEAISIADELKEENTKRQAIEQEIFQLAKEQVEEKGIDKNLFIVAYGEGWHSGVIGIVASKLQELWYHPMIVIGVDEKGVGKGSCRSVLGVDIFKALTHSKDLFINFGGHEQAAGFSISQEMIPQLIENLEIWGRENNVAEALKKTLTYDAIIQPENANLDLLEELEQGEPYGLGNPSMVFKMSGEGVNGQRIIGKDQNHLSYKLGHLACVGFNMAKDMDLVLQEDFECLCRIKSNEFRGRVSAQAILLDIKTPWYKTNTLAYAVLEEIKNDTLSEEKKKWIEMEGKNLIPHREMLVSLYQFLKSNTKEGCQFKEMAKKIPQANAFTLLAGLEILAQSDLIQYRLVKGVLFSDLCKTNEKKDIQKAALMIKLKELILV